MRTERFNEKHSLGLEKLTGDNSGLFYTNERSEVVVDEDGNEKTEWLYDVYEVEDARDPRKVKNSVIESEHPFGDELKILRKTLRKLMTDKQYNSADFAEFKAYNEFVEGV